MKMRIVVFVSCLAAGGVWARPVLQPEVKEYAAASGAAFAVKDLPVVHDAGETFAAAAGEVRAEGPKSVWTRQSASLPARGVFIAAKDSELGRLLVKKFALDVPAKKQGYALKAADGAVAIVGHDAIGAFYGAETFRQMAASGAVEPATVRDWPDILYRGAASAGRGLYPYSEGCPDRLPMMKAALDELARMKMNVICDHFWIHPDSDEKTFAFWREVNRYAAARGIFANDYGTTAVYQRHNYPKGRKFDTSWPCIRHHVSWNDSYYCWADDKLTEQAANAYADYVVKAGMEKGILIIHPVDDGGAADPEDWSKRCAKCKARWNEHERWKASVNQFDIWTRILRRRLPEAQIGSCIYPYTFGVLMKPEKDRTPKFRESTVEYWKNLSENMEDKDFFFSSWICSPVILRKIRELVPTRAFHFSDTYPLTSGIFHAFNRKACTVWEPQSENIFCTQGLDCNGKWESLALISECTWNKDAPCAEPYDGGTYYDPLVDQAGATPVFTEALPRICGTFWGAELAPYMTQVMASGVMPDYILNPPSHVKYWNSTRRDPLFDPTVSKKETAAKPKVQPIVDTPAMMGGQVTAAETCVKALTAAEAKAKALPPVQRRYFMKLAKGAPFWLASARVKYDVRRANELVGKGENAAALTLLKTAREQMEADYAAAAATLKRLAKEPDACGFNYKWGFDRAKARTLLDRAEASAKVVMEPRKIGRYVKVGIVKAGPCETVKAYFDRFENVKAAFFDSLSLASLDAFDCVIVLDKAYDKDEFFANLKTYAEKGAGGVYLEGALCGSKRWDVKTPFPEVVETAPKHVENFGQGMMFPDGRTGKTMYVDFFALKPGKKGEVRAYGPDGKTPFAVRGEAGLGKVFFNGTFSYQSVGGTYACAEKAELAGANAALLLEAVEYFTGVRLIEKSRSETVPAFDVRIPGSGYDMSKPDCGLSAAQVFDALESSRIGTLALRPAKDLPETSCTSVGFEGLDRKLFDPTDDVYDRLAACGIKRARVQTMWSRCETRKGVHDFSALDEVIRNLTTRGIRPWFSVTFGNTLYMAGCRTQAAVGNVPLYYGDECRAAWLAYVRALARRYRGQVTEWEIWNEPNCSNFWQPRGANARDYIELVKIAGEAIRSEIPDAKIGGTTSSGNLQAWERTFFEGGGAKYIDFWSFHPYGLLPEGIRQGGAVRDFVQEHVGVRAFIDSQGGGHVRIWQGESGCPSWFHKDHWLFPKGVCQQGWQSQANQAKWLLRRFVTDRRAGFDVSSFYQACDIIRRYSMAVTTRPHPAEHGLLNGWTHEPKMSYRAMGNYNALLADAKYEAAMKAHLWPTEDAGARTVVAGFRTAGGCSAYVYYVPFDFSGSYTGTVYRARTDAKLTLPKAAALKRPVVVDLLRGGIYSVKYGVVRGDEVAYADLPLVDYPVILMERGGAPLR